MNKNEQQPPFTIMAETEALTLIVIMTPKPGKKERVRTACFHWWTARRWAKQVVELMKKIIDGVIENETGALQYEMFENLNTNEICLVEKYHASFFFLQGNI